VKKRDYYMFSLVSCFGRCTDITLAMVEYLWLISTFCLFLKERKWIGEPGKIHPKTNSRKLVDKLFSPTTNII